jgi:hypothetical protein
VFISVFVLQELPSLAPFLTALANLVRPEDLALCVTLSPSFSQRLRDRGAIRSETDQDNSLKDWRWAGGFPVPVGKETVYLPHFQRDLEQITAIHFEHGLTVTNVKELTVPDTTEARKVFIETVYAEDIIAHPSSVLLTIRKSNQGVKQWHNISDPKNSR